MTTRIDFNLNFTPHPLTGDLTLVTGSRAIIQSLRNIVLTSFGERGFEPDFGSGVKSMLFENAGPAVTTAISDHIKTAISNYEKDVEIVNINVIWDDQDQGYSVDIYYTELNNPQTLVLNVSLVGLVR